MLAGSFCLEVLKKEAADCQHKPDFEKSVATENRITCKELTTSTSNSIRHHRVVQSMMLSSLIIALILVAGAAGVKAGEVSCGEHKAASCSWCPQGHGASWCNGDCKWCSDACQLKTKPCPVDGLWSEWTSYSPCCSSCGNGKKYRMRLCINPPPSNGGKDCQGLYYEAQQCNNKPCVVIVNGQWSAWSAYTPSSCSCGQQNEKQERTRTCSNPRPANGGSNCVGVSSQSKACEYRTCTDADYRAMQPCGGKVKTTFVGQGYISGWDNAIVPRSYSRKTLADCCNGCYNERRIRGLAWDSFFFRSKDKDCTCVKNARGLNRGRLGWVQYRFA